MTPLQTISRHALGKINDGKEATVYLCIANDGDPLAAKIYFERGGISAQSCSSSRP